jgi:hypothetical protein
VSTIYVIASHVQHANEEVKRLRPMLGPDDRILPILGNADMRGCTVRAGDQVVVVGAWDVRPTHEVKWLVDQFNSCRAHLDTVSLEYRPGEGPIVAHPEDMKPTGLRQSGFRYNYQPYPTSTTSTTTTTSTPPPAAPAVPIAVSNGSIMLVLDGTSIPIERFEVNDSSSTMEINATSVFGAGTVPSPSHVEWQANSGLRQELAEARRDCDTALEMVTRLSEWMLNVLPVEDSEIPGLYWCGICGRRTTAHESDCPRAPDAGGSV